MSNDKSSSINWHSKISAKLDSPETDMEDQSHSTSKPSWEES